MSRKIDRSVVVQQGSDSTFRVADNTRYLVLEKAWEGNQLLNTTIRAAFPGTPEGKAQAEIEAGRIREEAVVKSVAAAALGSIKSDAKAAAARENGKRGGRPRKQAE